jgi:hypothetical protein
MAPSFFALLWYYLTGNLREVRLAPGDRLESDAEQLLIVTRGTGHVVRDGPGGHDILIRVVRKGAILADGHTLMAETPLALLALPAEVSRPDRAAG